MLSYIIKSMDSNQTTLLILGVILLFLMSGSSVYQSLMKKQPALLPARSIGKDQFMSFTAMTPSGAVIIQGANGVGLDQGNQTIMASPTDITFNAGLVPGVNRMTIKGGTGNIGIGTTNPTKTLHINPGSVLLDGTTPSITFMDSGKGIMYATPTQTFGTSGIQDGLILYGNKDGALGTTDGGKGGRKAVLSWNSAGAVAINTNVNSTNGIPLSVYGNAQVANGTSYITTTSTSEMTSFSTSIYSEYGIVSASYGFLVLSDRRIKKNINQVSNVLDKIDQIEIVEYEHIDKDKAQKVDYGVIAQQVKPIVPNAIHKTNEFIPNLYMKADHTVQSNLVQVSVNTIIPDHIETNELIRIFCKLPDELRERRLELPVRHIDREKSILSFDQWDGYSQDLELFVYGSMAHDFHVVDKQQLGVMALAGVKELNNREKELIDQVNVLNYKIESQEHEINLLKKQVACLINIMESKLGHDVVC